MQRPFAPLSLIQPIQSRIHQRSTDTQFPAYTNTFIHPSTPVATQPCIHSQSTVTRTLTKDEIDKHKEEEKEDAQAFRLTYQN